MKTFVYFILAILLMIGSHATAGSYFSSRGNSVGLKQYSPSVRGLGLGGAGLASLDSLGLNNYVFAQWRHLNNTRASFALFYDYVDSEIGPDKFATSTSNFGGLSFAIPLENSGWTFGVSLQPYTSMDFKSIETVAQDDVNFQQTRLRDGNVSRAVAIVGWSPKPEFGVALHMSYYFGTIEDEYRFQFPVSSDFASYTHQVQYQVSSGPGIGFSADARPFDKLGIAGFVELEPNLTIKREYVSPNTNIDGEKGRFDSFPLYYGLGTNYALSSRWNLSLDYAFQQWSDAIKSGGSEFEDWYQISFGAEKSGNRRRSGRYLSRLDYRVGASTRQVGYLFNNASVQENSLHLGLGIPFSRNNYRVDAAFVAGRRGSLSENLASETFVRFELSATLGELWFQRIR